MTLKANLAFKNQASSEDLNQMIAKIIDKGIYEGGTLGISGSSLNITIAPFVAVGYDGMVVISDATETVTVVDGQINYVVLLSKYEDRSTPSMQFYVLSDTDWSASTLQDYFINFVKVDLSSGGYSGVTTAELYYNEADWSEKNGKSNWRPSVATNSALPTAQNRDGDVRMVMDEGTPYVWDATTQSWSLASLSTASAIDCAARSAWADGTTNPATDTYSAIEKIITDLIDTTGLTGPNAAGSFKIGSPVISDSPDSLATTTIGEQIVELLDLINKRGRLNNTETYTVLQNFVNGINVTAANDASNGVVGVGGQNGLYGETDGTGNSRNISGAYGYAYDPETDYKAFGVHGRSVGTTEYAFAIFGEADDAAKGSAGVLGVGNDSFSNWPSSTGTGGIFIGNGGDDYLGVKQDCGVIGMGGNSSNESYGGIFHGGVNTITHGRPGVVSYGSDADTGLVGYNGGVGGYFKGGTRSDVTGKNGIGIYAESGSDTAGYGGNFSGRYAGAGVACVNEDADYHYEAIKINSGIKFFRGNSDSESQYPDIDRAISNTLKATNIPKSWAHIYCQSTTPDAQGGFNIDNVSYNSNLLRVDWAVDFSDANYCVVATSYSGSGFKYLQVDNMQVGYVEIGCYDEDDVTVNLNGSNVTVNLIAFGEQDISDYDPPDVNL